MNKNKEPMSEETGLNILKLIFLIYLLSKMHLWL